MKKQVKDISKKFLTGIMGFSLLLTTGCIEIKGEGLVIGGPSVVIEEPDAAAKAALIKAIDTQATNLIKGINQVVITGNFVKNIAVQNPPQPIPIENNSEVTKALNYLLSYADANGQAIDYYPDSRICSDIIAKDDPRSCTKVVENLILTQIPSDSSSGIVEVRISGEKLVTIAYSSQSVSLFLNATEVVNALKKVSAIIEADGKEGFAEKLPTIHEGKMQLDIVSQLSISIVRASILSALDLRGKDGNGNYYSLQADASQSTLLVSLDSTLGLASASISLPQIQAAFSAMDEQNIQHSVQVQFPGASGNLTLENAISTIAVQALRLSSSDAFLKVDGQQAVHMKFADQINAEVQSAKGGTPYSQC